MRQQVTKYIKEVRSTFIEDNPSKIIDILCQKVTKEFPTVRQDLYDECGVILEDLIVEVFPMLENSRQLNGR